MEPIDLTGLNERQKNLLARYGVTIELLQILSRRDLMKVHRLGKKSCDQIVISLNVEALRLRRQNETIKKRIRAIFASPREIPVSHLIFMGVIDSVQWFQHFQVKLHNRHATYKDLTLLTCEDVCCMLDERTCTAIKKELAKYDIELAE